MTLPLSLKGDTHAGINRTYKFKLTTLMLSSVCHNHFRVVKLYKLIEKKCVCIHSYTYTLLHQCIEEMLTQTKSKLLQTSANCRHMAKVFVCCCAENLLTSLKRNHTNWQERLSFINIMYNYTIIMSREYIDKVKVWILAPALLRCVLQCFYFHPPSWAPFFLSVFSLT